MESQTTLRQRDPGIAHIRRGGGRAAVLGGYPRLSVWQVVLTARASRSLAAAARYLNVDLGSIRRALGYARRHPDEIETAIRANDDAFERARHMYPPAV